LLQYPDFEKEFIVTCDASAAGIGSVLSQGTIGRDLPIAYASRVLTKAEKNYSTIERELTAIILECKQFRPYIWGRKFTIVTDHKPLTWIFNMSDPNSRIMRLKLKLGEFEYTIICKKGKENSNSDGLSRMCMATTEAGDEKEKGRIGTLSTGSVNAETNEKVVDGLEERTKLTDKEKLEILKELYETPIGGHIGMNKTYKRLKQYISWEGMKEDVETFIKKCEKCQKKKLTQYHTRQYHTRMPLTLTYTPSVVFEKCIIDIVGPLSPSREGNRYILTVQDDIRIFDSCTFTGTNGRGGS
jgi:hypothetical protein